VGGGGIWGNQREDRAVGRGRALALTRRGPAPPPGVTSPADRGPPSPCPPPGQAAGGGRRRDLPPGGGPRGVGRRGGWRGGLHQAHCGGGGGQRRGAPRAAAARRRRSRRRSRAASAAASLPSPLPRCVCPVAGPLPAPHAARAPSLRARRPPQVRDGRLLVNGAAADEPFVSERAGYSLARLVVPPGDVRPAAARTCPGPRASPPAACTARL
jgi:hypothetical protein